MSQLTRGEAEAQAGGPPQGHTDSKRLSQDPDLGDRGGEQMPMRLVPRGSRRCPGSARECAEAERRNPRRPSEQVGRELKDVQGLPREHVSPECTCVSARLCVSLWRVSVCLSVCVCVPVGCYVSVCTCVFGWGEEAGRVYVFGRVWVVEAAY